MRGVLEIAILAGTGVLASGKVCKEAKASLVVQPYGSASSPSLAASCAISPVRARSCGTGKRAGRAKPAGASERCQPRASGHTTLEKILYTFRVRQTGAIAGETLYIYTRSVLIMMIVTAVSMRRAGAATPAFQASARALARVIPAVGARRRPAREARPATRASTTRRARAQDAGLALLLQAPLRGRGGHPILRGMRS